MKGLKKLALATAVAAAPFAAQADLKAMDDVSMGNVTGQAGVTIELETKVSIGQFKYTDTNDGGTDEIGGGSFAVNNIVLGGSGVAGGGSGQLSRFRPRKHSRRLAVDDRQNHLRYCSVSGGHRRSVCHLAVIAGDTVRLFLRETCPAGGIAARDRSGRAKGCAVSRSNFDCGA